MSRKPSFLHHWEGFLPTQTVVMGKRSSGEASVPNLAENQESAQPRPILSFVVPATLSADQADTFGKMTHALGLKPHELELIVGDASSPRGQGIVHMNSPQSSWANEYTLQTYPLQTLLDSPAAKKAIWNDLKLLLQRIQRQES